MAGNFRIWQQRQRVILKMVEMHPLISEFARIAHKEWNATGLRKGYMYMADVVTDPRWQRTYGTFGEDPEFIADVDWPYP